MKLNIVDVESIYRRLLASTDAEERESIFRRELLAPFEGMMRIFGGGDVLAQVKMWTLYTPEDFVNETRSELERLVDQMAAGDSWRRSAAALERGLTAFAPYTDQISLDIVTCALVLTDAKRANPIDRGYAGFGGIPGYVMVTYSQPTTIPCREWKARRFTS